MYVLCAVYSLFCLVALSAVAADPQPHSRRRLQTKNNKKAPPIPKLTDAWAHLTSPTTGTHISTDVKGMVKLIKCHNQSSCVMPQLQLQKKFKVYYCARTAYGVRFYYLIHEGLLLHPNIILTPDINEADVIVYLPTSSPWQKSECGNEKYFSKLLVLDEGDGPQVFNPDGAPRQWNILYFKRSFVSRRNGKFHGYMNYLEGRPKVLPMTYIIAEAYVRPEFPMMNERDYEIVCTLRGGMHDPTRLRVRQWVEEYAKARGVTKFVAGQVNSASRTEVSAGYFDQMRRARIIVTSNPSDWEGDFRLMEAISSGALIFVDHMHVHRPHPLEENKHIVYYDNWNKTDLFEKLDLYRRNARLSRSVALQGYLHSMKYHRAASLIDYIFRSVHLQQAMNAAEENLPTYTETGFDMRQQCLEESHAYAKQQMSAKGKPKPKGKPKVKPNPTQK